MSSDQVSKLAVNAVGLDMESVQYQGKASVVRSVGWSNAVGHVTLWNGQVCSDHCHLTADPDNGTFTPQTASLWKLP